MNNQEQDQTPQDDKKKSLQSDSKEVQENLRPDEDADAISHAGKKRDEDKKRYQ